MSQSSDHVAFICALTIIEINEMETSLEDTFKRESMAIRDNDSEVKKCVSGTSQLLKGD